jgi:hypothetical protein
MNYDFIPNEDSDPHSQQEINEIQKRNKAATEAFKKLNIDEVLNNEFPKLSLNKN